MRIQHTLFHIKTYLYDISRDFSSSLATEMYGRPCFWCYPYKSTTILSDIHVHVTVDVKICPFILSHLNTCLGVSVYYSFSFTFSIMDVIDTYCTFAFHLFIQEVNEICYPDRATIKLLR